MTSPEIQKLRKQSIAPTGTAETTAPTMAAPGAPQLRDPISAASREREAAMRSKYRDLERRYGTSRHISTAQRRQIEPEQAPPTPVIDQYTIQIRPRDAPPGTPLEPLLIAREQRRREEWIYSETVRAHELEPQLDYAVRLGQWHEAVAAQQRARERQEAEYNRQLAEYNKAVEEQRQLDASARPYGYETYAELLAAVQEEKLIRRLNELGAALTEGEFAARRGDLAAIEEQRQRAEAAQRSLETTWQLRPSDYLAPDAPTPAEYFSDLSAAVSRLQAEAPVMRTAAVSAAADDHPITIVSIGPPLKTSDYPAPADALSPARSPLGEFTRAHMPAWSSELAAGAAAYLTARAPATAVGIPYTVPVFTGFVRGEWEGVREEPEIAIASLAIGAAIPGVGKGISSVATRLAPRAAPAILSPLGRLAGAGLGGAYAGSVIGRTAAPDAGGTLPEAPEMAERLGRIGATEIAPLLAGGYIGQRATTGAIDIVRTRGLQEIPTADLVPEAVITGRATFPTEPAGRTPPPMLAARFRRAGEPLGFEGPRRIGGYHATTEPFPRDAQIIMGKRPYEGGGLSIAPEISPHFTRVARQEYTLFGLDLIPPPASRPTISFVRPEAGIQLIPRDVSRASMAPMAEYMLSPRATPGAAYIAPKYEAGWRRATLESEAMIPVGTETTGLGYIGYFRWRGRRIPIEERIALTTGAATPPTLSPLSPGRPPTAPPSAVPYISRAAPSRPVALTSPVSLVAASAISSIGLTRASRISLLPSTPGGPSPAPGISLLPSTPGGPSRAPGISLLPSTPGGPSRAPGISLPPSTPGGPSRAPGISLPPSILDIPPPRPPRAPEEDRRKGRMPWDEWYIHYAESPRPHARLESAYLGLADPAPARSRSIINLSRIQIGPAPRTPARSPRRTIGPRLDLRPRNITIGRISL